MQVLGWPGGLLRGTRRKLGVSVPCLCCAAATLKLSVMAGDVSPETKAIKSLNETLALCIFFNLS